MILLDRITVFCFAATYAVALVLELIQLIWPRLLPRWASLVFGIAGFLAHTIYLGFHPPALSSQPGSMLFLAWILATFYLYGSVHYRHAAWGIFVLPLVLGLTLWPSKAAPEGLPQSWHQTVASLRGEHFWSIVHGSLLLLAAVGVSVGFIASLMYLFQMHRLKAKMPPGHGLNLLSLERLEEMNRRAINLAFPLLTAGVLVGLALMVSRPDPFHEWTDPKILGAFILWFVFAILLYLRYGFHLRGRRVAFLTIIAFGLLLFTLASAHTTVQGGGP